MVEDEELSREPLADPGKVIRLSRGTAAEQIAALPKSSPKPKPTPTPTPTRRSARTKPAGEPALQSRPEAAPKAKGQPRPDRKPVELGRKAIDDLRARHEQEQEEMRRCQAELDRDRVALNMRQAKKLEKLNRDAERIQTRCDKALATWRG